jgi:ribosomal subunit interface protein
MLLPVQITVRDVPTSSALETLIRKRAERLNRYNDSISSCRVVIELKQKHKHQGKLYNVRIDITVPGKELAVTHKYDEDIYVAIRDAFNAVARRLEEHSRIRNGHVKAHQDVVHGHISRLVLDEGYGFIDGMDGNEYYFSLTNVIHPGFSQLLIGDAVEFMAHPLSDGNHAHHIVREKHNNHIAA